MGREWQGPSPPRALPPASFLQKRSSLLPHIGGGSFGVWSRGGKRGQGQALLLELAAVRSPPSAVNVSLVHSGGTSGRVPSPRLALSLSLSLRDGRIVHFLWFLFGHLPRAGDSVDSFWVSFSRPLETSPAAPIFLGDPLSYVEGENDRPRLSPVVSL